MRFFITIFACLTLLACAATEQPKKAEKANNQEEKATILVAVYAPNIEEEKLLQLLSDNFKENHSELGFEPVVFKTTDVMTAVLDGYADIGISSRHWDDKEVALMQTKYQTRPVTLTLGADALALVVNADNNAKAIGINDVKAIFGPSSCTQHSVANWQQLGADNFADDEDSSIKAVVVDNNNRFSRLLKKELLCDNSLTENIIKVANNAELDKTLSKNKNAISFKSLSELESGDTTLAVVNAVGKTLPARLDYVFSGEYPLSKVYYLHLSPKAQKVDNINEYAHYLMSDEVQNTLNLLNFVPLPEAIKKRNLILLDAMPAKFQGGYR